MPTCGNAETGVLAVGLNRHHWNHLQKLSEAVARAVQVALHVTTSAESLAHPSTVRPDRMAVNDRQAILTEISGRSVSIANHLHLIPSDPDRDVSVYRVHMTHPELDRTLSLHHASEVTDPTKVRALAATEDEEATIIIVGYISEHGRVLAWQTAEGERVLFAEAISVDEDLNWTPTGTPRIYRIETDDRDAITSDTRRLFLSQSLANGAARATTGWRDRIVALIPEEVGAKESKIIRTLADGNLEVTHTYNVLDAYAKYSEWVHELAAEFGGTDEKLEAGIETPDVAPFSYIAATIAQAWLLRAAADAELQQARASLAFGLAAFSRLGKLTDADPNASVAELARSLHTDRPNLTRAIKAAEGDRSVRAAMARIDELSR